MSKKCQLYIYTGEGAGKTTSSLGLALRAIGHGYKVGIVQLMKGWKDIGEYKIVEKLAPLYEIYQFGSPEFIDLKNPSEEDKKRALDALKFAEEKAKEKPFLLIMDEINIALSVGLIKLEDVQTLIDATPEETTLVFTGRYAPKELVEIADFVNEINDIKHPFKDGAPAKRGIQY